MPHVLLSRALTTDEEIHAVLGFQDSGLIDWGFTEDDLPAPVVVQSRRVRHLAAVG